MIRTMSRLRTERPHRLRVLHLQLPGRERRLSLLNELEAGVEDIRTPDERLRKRGAGGGEGGGGDAVIRLVELEGDGVPRGGGDVGGVEGQLTGFTTDDDEVVDCDGGGDAVGGRG